MKPLLSIVVTICLVLAVRADSEKPKHAKEPVEEVKPSDSQARKERCSACASSAKLKLKNPKDVLAAVKQLPEVHTQQTFEGCLPDKGCAGIKVKDGQIIEIFGNLEAFRQAAAQNSGSEFSFHEAGSSVFQNGGPFWWAGNDSPFKNSGSSYDTISKTSSSFASTGGAVDFSGNPFLNGDISKVSGGFSSVGGGSAGSAAAGGAGIDKFQSSSSFESSSFGKGQLDLSKNPFLNGAAGQFNGQSGFGAQSGFGGAGFSESTQGYVGSSPSPFSPGPTAGSNINLIQNGQKGFGYEQNVDEAFQSTGNVLGTDQGDLTQTCAGQGYVCVPRAQCNNGVVNTNGANVLQANTQKQYCNLRSEICCRIEVSSLSGTNGLAGSGLGVDSATFSGSNQGSGLIAGSQGFGSSSFGSASGFGVSNIGPKAIGGQGSSSVGSASGFGVSNIGTKAIGGQGSSNFENTSGFGVSNMGTKANRGYGSSVGTTLAPTSPGVFGSSQTNFIETDAFASGSEFRPGAIGLKPGIPYLPPVDSSNSPSNIVPSTVYPTSFVTTPRPFSTPKPTYLPPVPSTSAPGYLPPVAESSIPREVIVPPYTEGGLLLDQTRPGTQRPFIPGPSPSEIPAGCAAALKCTPIEFCTAEGVISQTSVILTREQENYRVPLTDCKDIESGRIGKCCRDPFYTDPWPTNQLGKWVPGVFGGNDGKYVPDNKGSPSTNPKPQVTVRPPTVGQTILPVFTSSEVPPTSGRGKIPTYPTPTVTPRPFGQGQYGKQGVGQTGLVGIGQIGIGGQGKVVRPGTGVIISEGGGQITNDGVEVNQGIGTFGQDQGFDATFDQGVQTSQGVGVQTGVGYGVKQQSGIGISQGFGTGVKYGTGQRLVTGRGQATINGQGQKVVGGIGYGIQNGGGFAVNQGGSYGVENEYSESTHRVFLQRYSGAGQCGLLNPQKPYGNRNELEVDFAEIPWQAMVLLQTNRSLLCGGVITRPEVVVTSASCVDGLDAKNVLIKGGEWKLGIDDEPLPFQIVQVKTIIRHPEYQRGSLKYDVAILVLADNLRFANNIQPICLPSQSDTLDAFYNGAGECIVTGWGKTVLQAHLQGSIMHALNVSLINPGECQAKLSSDYPHLLEAYDQDSCVCGQPTNPLNNICRVDIGSALACTTGDSHFVLRGVYSWDSGCQIGNQIAGFFKFDIEWYEWAIGLIESVRFAKYTKVTVGKVGTVTSVKTTQYTSGVKTTGVKEFTNEGGSGNIGQFSQVRGQVGQSGQTGLVGQGQFEQTGQSLTKVTQGFGQGQSNGQGQIGLTGQTVTKVSQGFGQGQSTGQGQFGLTGQSLTKVSQGFGQGQSTGQGQFGLTGQSLTKVSQGFGQGQSTGQRQFGLTGQSVTKVSQGFGQGQSTGQGQFGLTGQSVTKVTQGFGQAQSGGSGQFGQASAGQVSQFGGVSQVSGETKYSTGSLLLSPEIKSPITKTVTTTFTSSGKITGGKGTGSIQGAGKDIGNGFGQFSQVGGGSSEQFSQFTTGGVKGVSGSGAVGGFGTFPQVSGGSEQFKVDGQIAQGLGGKATGQGFGQFSQFESGKFTEGGLNFGSDIKPITNSFSATYSEKKVFQSEPKIITYTTKPEIVTFTTKPEIVTFTTKPEYFTYTTKPEIVTFTTKPEYFTFTTKPKLVRYTTKPQYITYQTSDTITSPQVVAPDVSLNPSFTEVVGKHKHNAQCKCLEGKK